MLFFSICIPVYQGSKYLKGAVQSIINQSFDKYEIIILDDNPIFEKAEIKRTREIINSFANPRISYHKNRQNMGSAKSIKKLAALAKGDVLFYLCQDDILAAGSLQKTHDAFFLDKDIGVVTRPFFWYGNDITKPIREVSPYDRKKTVVLSLFDGPRASKTLFGSVGQISGLAYRKEYITIPFHDDVFPGHIYPFASILKRHKAAFLKDYTVAVRTYTSQSRHLKKLYEKSPLQSWVDMFTSVYRGHSLRREREFLISEVAATNYLGLAQIRNFGHYSEFIREVSLLLTYRRRNVLSLGFWVIVLGLAMSPRPLSRFFVDWYKREIVARFIPPIHFEKP